MAGGCSFFTGARNYSGVLSVLLIPQLLNPPSPQLWAIPGTLAPPGRGAAMSGVVEDELLLRLDLANQLHSAGFEIIESQSADEALKILATKIDVDLILTDIRMPGQVDGLGLVSFVQRQERRYQTYFVIRIRRVPTVIRPQTRLLQSPSVSERYSQKFDNCLQGKTRLTCPTLEEPHASSTLWEASGCATPLASRFPQPNWIGTSANIAPSRRGPKAERSTIIKACIDAQMIVFVQAARVSRDGRVETRRGEIKKL